MREVYVQPFPVPDNEIRISLAGGAQPRWRADGKELFYLAMDGKLTAVPVSATAGPKPSFKPGVDIALRHAMRVEPVGNPDHGPFRRPHELPIAGRAG